MLSRKKQFCVKIANLSWLWLVAVCLVAPQAAAQEVSYDRYAALYEKPPQAESALKKGLTHFLVYPFELFRWPVKQTLNFIEKEHLDKKFQWAYDQLQSYGITPKANIVGIKNLGGGADVDFVRLARLKEDLPDATVHGWFHWTDDVRLHTGARVGMERIGGTGFQTFGRVSYEKRPEEFFFGIGPQSSAGDGAIFSMETTTLGASAGYSSGPTFRTDFNFLYRNVNISNGRDGGRGKRGEIPTFNEVSTPGINGDSLLTYEIEMVHDTRNQKENSTSGGLRRLAFSFNDGLHGSDSEYFKYQMEFSQYFRLGSDRRVLVVRFYGEHNDALGEHEVPFHQMPKLGGHGMMGNRLSHTLRSYDFNRFFDDSAALINIEYRYTIWEYREFKMDAAFFWDEGQVFEELSKFQLSDFRESYGLGFRLSLANVILLSTEFAHGDEGTRFYVKSHAPF